MSTDAERKDAKRRIFEAGVSLFARKGYAAVGIREIARAAHVNLSMVSYYYGGKAGLLSAIIDEAYARYREMLAGTGDDSTPAEAHVRNMVRGIVRFFRENAELGLVGFDSFPPVDNPETMAVRLKWSQEIGGLLSGFCRKLGLDVNDLVQMWVALKLLPVSVKTFFEGIYSVEQSGAKGQLGPLPEFDDEFFERYSENLASLFLYGVTGMTKMSRPRKARSGRRSRRR
ncbi:TetR family transcriptional regulator [candidate division WOR-3 bacterium]|nr:TetR family transcriptional regulator [candidate division WOR-3 bacterium]